jgi:hypothetical protein
MLRRLIVILLYFLVSCFPLFSAATLDAAPADSAPAEIGVVVIGTGRLQGDDVDAARTQAISSSLVTAIDRAIADLMPTPLKVEHFKALNSTLYSEPERFVVGYKVLTETMTGKTYRALVEATLSMAALRKYLAEAKLLPESIPSRRILFLIAEQNVEDPAPNYWWGKERLPAQGACESRMAEVLQQLGFKMVSHDQSPPPATEDAAGAPPPGSGPTDAEALALGKRFQADVIIVAMVTTQSVGNVMGDAQKSFKAVFAGRMFRVDTGEKMGDIFRTAVAMGPEPRSAGRQALGDVGALAAEALAPQIKAAWQKKEEVRISATLFVEGTRNLSNFVSFRNLLKESPLVIEVEPNGIKPNEATLLLRLKGTTQALADALMLKSNEGFGINISEITEDTLRLSLVPK